MVEKLATFIGAFAAILLLHVFVIAPLSAFVGGLSAMFTLGYLAGFDGYAGLTNFQLGALIGFAAALFGGTKVDTGD